MAKKNNNASASTKINIKKLITVVLCVYVLLVVSFYFLAGDQLHIRDSRGNITMPAAETSVAELTSGTVFEQRFHTTIQRLKSVSVQWGTYYRPNAGIVSIELLRQDTDEQLMQGIFDAALISEGQILSISAETPIETVYEVPLILRLTSDSIPGSAVTPMINVNSADEDFYLYVNGEMVPGMLCFSASGTDYIWTGIHYWKLAVGFGVFLTLIFVVILLRWHNGKNSYVISTLVTVKKYRFLIRQLVLRDFKIKYKRSLLGVFWSFLNPLLMMIVQYFVFSTIFKSDIPNFAAYLIIGTVMFNFFSESCTMTLNSILGNAPLITKVNMPKYIYPLTRTMSSVVNLAISLIPMLIVCLVTGIHFQKATILSLFFFFCLIVFSLGLGTLLSTSMVFFRDTQFLWGVLSMMWMYATPIFYPERIIPDNLKIVLQINPLYHFLKAMRKCILDGISPEPVVYIQCLGIAFGMLLIGAVVFYRNQDKFVLYF